MRTKLNVKRSSVLTLLTGALFGFSFAYFLFYLSDSQRKWGLPVQEVKSYLRHIPLPADEGPTDPVPIHGDHADTVGEELSEKVRLLCWIMTQPSSHEKKARHVRNTWGRRCNYLIFMSTESDYSLPAIRLKVKEGRNALWAKTKESFKYVYQHYMDRVDWVLKADDDTYVIVENLKFLLSQYNASERLYFGCRFKPFLKMGYMSGGAGYVLSKAAVKAFVEEALPKKSCRQDGEGAEDVEMGKCLEQVNVTVVDSRDAFGRHRFLPLPPVYFLVPHALPKSNWFWRYIYDPMKEGFDCCSDSSISFHYISPNEMYVLEYFIYHVRPYGISFNHATKTSAGRNEAAAATTDSKQTSHVSENTGVLKNTVR
ncbi:UNVERIFIED_CONTAM: hypothetical protein PYX00_010412 [Menopon gallinae]|uniref:Glycoprotein-N-acetylgalactosamine 3-beta-galactosyltransferase 1 n=1 Tax=Menopon gallinae TaxID=328185 RepID=A0AAW2HF52_9NEOP